MYCNVLFYKLKVLLECMFFYLLEKNNWKYFGWSYLEDVGKEYGILVGGMVLIIKSEYG